MEVLIEVAVGLLFTIIGIMGIMAAWVRNQLGELQLYLAKMNSRALNDAYDLSVLIKRVEDVAKDIASHTVPSYSEVPTYEPAKDQSGYVLTTEDTAAFYQKQLKAAESVPLGQCSQGVEVEFMASTNPPKPKKKK